MKMAIYSCWFPRLVWFKSHALSSFSFIRRCFIPSLYSLSGCFSFVQREMTKEDARRRSSKESAHINMFIRMERKKGNLKGPISANITSVISRRALLRIRVCWLSLSLSLSSRLSPAFADFSANFPLPTLPPSSRLTPSCWKTLSFCVCVCVCASPSLSTRFRSSFLSFFRAFAIQKRMIFWRSCSS